MKLKKKKRHSVALHVSLYNPAYQIVHNYRSQLEIDDCIDFLNSFFLPKFFEQGEKVVKVVHQNSAR